MTEEEEKRGGARTGAGRPKLAEISHKLSFLVEDELFDQIVRHRADQAVESLSELIRQALVLYLATPEAWHSEGP